MKLLSIAGVGLMFAALSVRGEEKLPSATSSHMAPQRNMASVLPAVDMRHSVFSRRNCWLSLLPAAGHPEIVVVNNTHNNGARGRFAEISLTDGSGPELKTSANPSVLTLADNMGKRMRIALDGKGTLVVVAEKAGIRIASGEDTRPVLFVRAEAQPDGRSWRIAGLFKGEYLWLHVVSGKIQFRDGVWTMAPNPERVEVVMQMGSKEAASGPLPDLEQCAASAEGDWRSFRATMPSVRPESMPAAEQAWYCLWSSQVPATQPNFITDVVLMSKAERMNAVWPWDHCFVALALALGDPDAGFDQLTVPFHKQLPDGSLPDNMCAENDCFTAPKCTKPPIHGWALGKMMDAHRFRRDQLEWFYPRLAKWTDFWFACRDNNRNGIPGFGGVNPGWDCGWDNSSCIDKQSKDYEAPELQAFLILQMRTLARIADELAKPDAATAWRKRAEAHLALFHEKFWKDGKLALPRKDGTELATNFTGLEPLMCWVLGDLLTKDEQQDLLRRLSGYETDWGLATEMPGSRNYSADGYWRGPIWAPSTYLVVDGLARAGRRDEARRLAVKFDRLIAKAGGYYENYEARSGQGLRCKAYTWTPAVHMLMLHEFAADDAAGVQR